MCEHCDDTGCQVCELWVSFLQRLPSRIKPTDPPTSITHELAYRAATPQFYIAPPPIPEEPCTRLVGPIAELKQRGVI